VNIGRNMFSISEYEKLVQLSIDYTLNLKIQAESTEMFCVHKENIHLFAKTVKVTLLLSSIYL
jgi:isocitrate dehydrogenase